MNFQEQREFVAVHTLAHVRATHVIDHHRGGQRGEEVPQFGQVHRLEVDHHVPAQLGDAAGDLHQLVRREVHRPLTRLPRRARRRRAAPAAPRRSRCVGRWTRRVLGRWLPAAHPPARGCRRHGIGGLHDHVAGSPGGRAGRTAVACWRRRCTQAPARELRARAEHVAVRIDAAGGPGSAAWPGRCTSRGQPAVLMKSPEVGLSFMVSSRVVGSMGEWCAAVRRAPPGPCRPRHRPRAGARCTPSSHISSVMDGSSPGTRWRQRCFPYRLGCHAIGTSWWWCDWPAAAQRGGVGHALDHGIDAGYVQGFVHQQVGFLGQLHHRLRCSWCRRTARSSGRGCRSAAR